MASNEGSILILCTTSLALGLIKPHEKLDHPPSEGNRNVISSSVDKIKKKDESQFNVHMLSRKPNLKTSNEEAPIMCSRDEHSVTSSNREQFKDGCSKKEQSDTTCTEIDAEKNCQTEKCDMWPVKPQMDVQLKKLALKSSNKKLIGVSKDKNCQAKICEYDDFKSQSSKCFDKECQENIKMQSVTNTDNMHLPKPAIRRLCSDKNCQSTRCYKKRNYDKYCQFV